MAADHVRRRTRFDADLTHLVLGQLAQGLNQGQLHILGKAAHVVVRLDDTSLAGLGVGEFDHLRVGATPSKKVDSLSCCFY